MVIRNKRSGRYFIVLDEDPQKDAMMLMITPAGFVKHLERRLFGGLEMADPMDPVWSQMLSEVQLEKYREYLDTFIPRN